ncbi:helix-turn-helix transcriptional regulator [Streptomyces cocklensis]|jgi:sugar-specific transcriptional regulator TrmB/DNA-binding CsgD family transcriptional regulator|uniref:Sugar-specific transcriptional regulator TrmB n=1 Tax=Actinacidiphila cocklensis TaxID=887465 RepID=A0A9W4DR90_9ACTN|nr:helix-turn-helix domain-containing protein [Actinacidiphila cocklensis]MDD1062695.1 helix-turn-helix transcriptional regulator [Actinacidiphila cocklensis]WSX75431.1 helix-turn-helix transcriptional regulator [Streptomyces sp. NBC_00899]CAG6392076.1 Sugar-specific transcriptional regulator TrmB [Actinacidiphila cocklensis]
MLESVGLDEASERVYRMLVVQPPLTLQEVADHVSDVSAAGVRRILETLTEAGLAELAPGRPLRWSAVDPRLGLAAMIRTRRAELDRTTAALETYAADFHERMLRTDPHRLVEVIEGPIAITAHLTELMAGAQQEVLAFDTPPYVTVDHTASSAEQDLLGRGISVRAVYSTEVLAIPDRADRLRSLVSLGEQARVAPRVPLKMVLVDDREAVIPLTASAEGIRTSAALVRRSRLCDALRELFEAHWAQAVPVFSGTGGTTTANEGHPDLLPADRSLLHLLNAGLKDEAILRQLGISERTLRRRINELTARLGATSRFQAGAQAVRRGWL